MTDMERLRQLQPAAGAALADLERVAWESTDPELLQLCRDRATTMLRGETNEEPGAAGPREQAYLDFTEQFVTSVSTISDEQIEALLEYSSPNEIYAFAGALYALEMSERVHLVAAAVLR